MRNIFFPHYLSGEPIRVHEGRLAPFNVRMNIMSDNK